DQSDVDAVVEEADKEKVLTGELDTPPELTIMDDTEKKEFAPHIEELAESILKLNLLEASDLADCLKEKLNMDDATFLMAMGGMPSGMAMAVAPEGDAEDEGAAAEPVAEKTHFDVVMKGFDAKAKIKIIKEVRAITSLGLKEAKELVENTPATIGKDMKKEEAEKLAETLKELGAEVELE
ncbi:rplL, partial [Symbiodinium sp. KB8]